MKDANEDFGKPAKVIFGDLQNDSYRTASTDVSSEWTISGVLGAERYRLKMLTVSGTNNIEELWIVKLTETGSDVALHLSGAAAVRFVSLIRNNAFDSVDGVESGPSARFIPGAAELSAAYEHDPEALRSLIEGDAEAKDIIAITQRRRVVAEFRRMLHDKDYFDELVGKVAGSSKEKVWQVFFESNPWLLGITLSAHLLVGWDEGKLERAVVGADVGGPGKRADALLKTAGLISLIALAEIKHHRTDLLLSGDYRSGCHPPSSELAGAVAQSHGTVQLAIERLGSQLKKFDDGGFDTPSERSYLYRPRSFVVVGTLSEFVNPDTGGHHEAKIRSFELYRRNLQEPVILTFDELLSRAEALLAANQEELP